MKNGKNRLILEKLRTATYTEGAMANICWTPNCTDLIRDKVSHHVHSFYEILFVEKGSGSHRINGETVPASAGHLALFAPGSAHDPAELTGAAVWVLIFNPQVLDAQGWAGAIHTKSAHSLGAGQRLLRSLHNGDKQHLLFQIPAEERGAASTVLRRIEVESASHRVGWEQTVQALLALILVDLLRRHLKNQPLTIDQNHPTVTQVMDFIDLNFRRPIELGDIAKHVGRSRAYLTNLIKRHTGMSAIAWLSDRRLVEAKSLILTSRKSVQQIAEELGYESVRHFSHMFKRRFGDSPMQWRGRIMG